MKINITVIIICAALLAGCSSTRSSCDGVDTSKSGPFDLSGMDVSIKRKNNGDSIKLSALGTVVNRDIEITISTQQTWLSDASSLWSLIIPNANACTVASPWGGSTLTLLRVVLIDENNNEMDASNLFSVSEESDFSGYQLPMALPEYVTLKPRVSRSYTLTANNNISVVGTFKIAVFLHTSSGKVFFISNGPFNIVNSI